MNPRLLARAVILATLTAAAAGCGGRQAPATTPATGPAAGVFKVRLEQEGEKPRKFKMSLFAELPDRIHGEIGSPVGTTVVVFDGGNGRLAVTFVRDRVAYVGPADAESVRRTVGIPVTLRGLVSSLMTGRPDSAELTVVREGPSPGLPDRLEISGDGRRLTLELTKRRTLRVAPDSIGTGEPRAGLEVRPLDELRLREDPGPGLEG
jgi:hypothetical protein